MLAFAKLIAHEGLIEPRRAKVVAAIFHEDANCALAEATRAAIDFDNLAADGLHVLFVKIGDRAAIGEVFVIAREEEDEIASRTNIKPVEQFGSLRADAADEPDRRGEHFGRRGLAAGRSLLAGGRRQGAHAGIVRGEWGVRGV